MMRRLNPRGKGSTYLLAPGMNSGAVGRREALSDSCCIPMFYGLGQYQVRLKAYENLTHGVRSESLNKNPLVLPPL